MVFATPNVRQDASPETWREHHFGLSALRWRQLARRGFWIIGAGTGYGEAIAVALALAGARVILSGRRADKLAQTRDRAGALGGDPARCDILPCDATEPAQVDAAVAEIARRGIVLHGLVHSAALPQP